MSGCKEQAGNFIRLQVGTARAEAAIVKMVLRLVRMWGVKRVMLGIVWSVIESVVVLERVRVVPQWWWCLVRCAVCVPVRGGCKRRQSHCSAGRLYRNWPHPPLLVCPP